MITSHASLLQLSILAPLVAGFVLFFTGRMHRSSQQIIAGVGFLLPAVIALFLAYQYGAAEKMAESYAFYSEFNTGLQQFGISLKLGLNGISLPLYLLAGIVGLASGIYAMTSNSERIHLYLALLLIMQAGLMGTFASVDIFFFYFLHELALIPTFIMIGIWGGRGRRAIAMELTIYLTLGAMLSLIGIISIYMGAGLASFDLITLKQYLREVPLSETLQSNAFGLLMIGFGILVSLFPFHTWAPRGYAAAPTSAAMLHAGVLKKFGLYGLLQVAAPLLPSGAAHWVQLLAYLALANILIIGLVTIAQKDLKQMIGYSSVMHMGYCFLGIACLTTIGTGAAVMLMFAHGLSVSLLFLLSEAIYTRTKTLEMSQIGGLSQKAPILCAFFLAATLANIGLPGFANFWGEIGVFISLWDFQPWMVYPAVAGVIISAIYGLRAMANIFFGQPTEAFQNQFDSNTITDITSRERIPALLLLITLLLVGFWPKILTEPLNQNLIASSNETTLVAPISLTHNHEN